MPETIETKVPWPKVTGDCENCHERPATGLWGGLHDQISIGRNPHIARPWCELCIVREQVAYGRRIAALLPERLKRLQELESEV